MKRSYLKSSPHFFRPVLRAFWIGTAALLLLATLIPAPLQEPASLAKVPNPVKSAWFLLWIQELVSYRIWLIYPLIVLGLLFIGLPWLQRDLPEQARWFGRPHRLQAVLVLFLFVLIVASTVVGLWFRGENWALVWPF